MDNDGHRKGAKADHQRHQECNLSSLRHLDDHQPEQIMSAKRPNAKSTTAIPLRSIKPAAARGRLPPAAGPW